MSDAMSIRQWAGEFDYPPAPTFRDSDEFCAVLGALTPAGRGWSTDGPDGYEVAIFTERETTLAAVESVLAYLWAGPMRGEWWPGEGQTLIPGHLYVFAVDTTKSQRDDVADAWDTHAVWLVEGTPVRKTDKAGRGTKGTRACAGLGPVLVAWR